MKKRGFRKSALVLVGFVLLSGLVGCGNDNVDSVIESEQTEDISNTGTVLNIHSSGEELKERIMQLYPDYEEISASEGKIGDVTVRYIITPNEDNAYQFKMDELLGNIDNTGAEDRMDLFTVEADYAKKYAKSGCLMTMEEIGLSKEDMANQYSYTQDMIKDDNGEIYGSSWQATPGFFLYRRSIAQAVFGTDEPAEVQEHLSTWEKMDESAQMLKDNGYVMFSAYNDSYYPFNANKDIPWVNDDLEIQVADSMYDWVEQTKTYSDQGYNNKKYEMSDIVMDIGKGGNVFGAFAAPWYMDFIEFTCLDDPSAPFELGNGSYADWAVCNGPESFYWGGTWLCVPKQCDNVELVRDIIYVLTCDDDAMTKLVNENGEFVNNSKVMKEMAASDYQCAFLGGQNHLGLLIDAVEDIDMSNVTLYDQGVGDSFKDAFRDYFAGNVSMEDALAVFYESAVTLYPDLKKPE